MKQVKLVFFTGRLLHCKTLSVIGVDVKEERSAREVHVCVYETEERSYVKQRIESRTIICVFQY